jgi:endonuclease/exonuclease/phosphatase family metal-dependent hydrolase
MKKRMLRQSIYSILIFCVLMLSVGVGEVSAKFNANNRDRELSVMTRNMYLGTDFNDIFTATDQISLFIAVGAAYSNVQAGNPQERITGIADEIEAASPTLVGLQEVALWETGAFGNPAPADTVAFDFLAMLHTELAARGLRYATVAEQRNFYPELPAFINFAPAFDVRFTDRTVILARTDLKTSQFKLENTRSQQFTATFSVATILGEVPIARGWNSADVKLRGKNYRFVNTHLESFDSTINFMQATELLQTAGNTNLPLIFAGDFNSDAESNDATYQLLINAGFADVWEQTNPNDSGFTWALFLTDPSAYTNPTQRLDLILKRGNIDALDADIVGENPATDRTPSGLMRSDHAGVTATLNLKP